MSLIQKLTPTFDRMISGMPMRPQLLDILFTFNIAMAVLVLLVSVSSKSPLDFSLFPTVILVTIRRNIKKPSKSIQM